MNLAATLAFAPYAVRAGGARRAGVGGPAPLPRADAAAARFVLAALLCALLAWVQPARANEVPWGNQRIELFADNEALAPFLLRLFARLRIPAIASPLVTGKVSGSFNQRPEVLFRELAESYGLSWYYDGATMHLYSIAEIESRLLSLDPTVSARFGRLLADLKIVDARFPVRVAAGDGYVSVSGPPRYLARIEELAAFLESSLGRAGRPQAVRTFRLRHAWAVDRRVVVGGVETLIPGVASVLQAVLNEQRAPGTAVDDTLPRQLPATLPPMSGLGGRGLATLGRNGAAATPPASGAPSPAAPPAEAPRASPDRARIDGSAAIKAEQRLNAIVVRDAVEKMPMYEELIRALDQPSPLVEIEATVVDISSERSQALGVDFALLLGNRPGFATPPVIAINDGTGGLAQAPRVGAVAGNDKSFLLARINALAQEGDASVQSKPRVLTIDNNEAVLSSTQEFFVRVPGRDVADLFNVSVGLTLRVTPSIAIEGDKVRFKMQVRIDDGSLSATQAVDGVPIVARSAISASVVVDEGESLFIGGLISEVSANGLRGVPGLSKVPLLGRLFSTREQQSRKVERMFLLTPKLVKGLPS